MAFTAELARPIGPRFRDRLDHDLVLQVVILLGRAHLIQEQTIHENVALKYRQVDCVDAMAIGLGLAIIIVWFAWVYPMINDLTELSF